MSEINFHDNVEYFADGGCWETAICIEEKKDSFTCLCLDGCTREFTNAEIGTKWRVSESF